MTDPSVLVQSLTPSAIHEAYSLIQPYVHRTPLLTCQTLNTIASAPQSPEALSGTSSEGQTPANPKFRFFFKCENYQRIGAFKARGAFHALLRLIAERGQEDVQKRGVITHSSGRSSLSPSNKMQLEGNHAIFNYSCRKSRTGSRSGRLHSRCSRLHYHAQY